MDKETGKQGPKLEIPAKFEFENSADRIGLWFAAGVMFAVLAAGIIMYQIGNADLRSASNEALPTTVARPN